MNKYRLIAKKGEGTFSEVLKAVSIKSGKPVAIKCMKTSFDSIEKVNNLREIQALRRLTGHPHIIKLYEVLYDEPSGRLALVFELMDMNVYEAIQGRRHYLPEPKIANWIYQGLLAMDHMHRNGIFHRDIKPENLLIVDDVLKIADLGSCKGVYTKQPFTEYISTRWYRAPECLLTDGYYTYKMDIWGIGCVFFEVMALFPLFPGTDEIDQINRIHHVLGTPPPHVISLFQAHASHIDCNFPIKQGIGLDKLLPHASTDLLELLSLLIAYNPEDRLSAKQALRHTYFESCRLSYESSMVTINNESQNIPSSNSSSVYSNHNTYLSKTSTKLQQPPLVIDVRSHEPEVTSSFFDEPSNSARSSNHHQQHNSTLMNHQASSTLSNLSYNLNQQHSTISQYQTTHPSQILSSSIYSLQSNNNNPIPSKKLPPIKLSTNTNNIIHPSSTIYSKMSKPSAVKKNILVGLKK